MTRLQKRPSDSLTKMAEIVYPHDTNPMGMLHGGKILHWMDTACAISAQIHAGNICVTVAIDSVHFRQAAKIGDIILIIAKPTRAFKSSLELYAEARVRKLGDEEERLINSAYFTFVALKKDDMPYTEIPELVPQTTEEEKMFGEALNRRNARLNEAANTK